MCLENKTYLQNMFVIKRWKQVNHSQILEAFIETSLTQISSSGLLLTSFYHKILSLENASAAELGG